MISIKGNTSSSTTLQKILSVVNAFANIGEQFVLAINHDPVTDAAAEAGLLADDVVTIEFGGQVVSAGSGAQTAAGSSSQAPNTVKSNS